MKDIVPIKNLVELADAFAKSSISAATRRAYESDWRQFDLFCQKYELEELPATPETICLYISSMAEQNAKVATIVRRCTSISAIHRAAGHDSPTRNDKVARVLKGIKNQKGAPSDQSKALSWLDLQKLVAQCNTSMILGVRDAAILSLGWASAMRRSELVALNHNDLDFVDEGIIITIRRSKTDQTGKGQKIGIPKSNGPICPVRFVQAWIDRRKPTLKENGPLFERIGATGRNKWWCETKGIRLSSRMVSEIVKHYAQLAGFNPARYSAHSLRRGFATEVGARGVPERIISRHTRHRSVEVLRGYIEAGHIWTENPLNAVYSSSSSGGRGLE